MIGGNLALVLCRSRKVGSRSNKNTSRSKKEKYANKQKKPPSSSSTVYLFLPAYFMKFFDIP